MANEANVEKLVTDLKVLSRDAEAMLHATAGQAGEKIAELRTKLAEALKSAKDTCHRLEDRAIEGVKEGAKVADKAIREHPYESVGVAFGLGLLIGVLVGRR